MIWNPAIARYRNVIITSLLIALALSVIISAFAPSTTLITSTDVNATRVFDSGIRVLSNTSGVIIRDNLGKGAIVKVLVADLAVNPATTSFLSLPSGTAASGTESAVEVQMPMKGRVKNLHTEVTADSFNAGTYTVTVRKNGIDTTLTLQYTAGETGTKDDNETVEFIAGDKLTIKKAQAGGASGSLTGLARYEVEFDNI